jgi:hypothetical protein
MTPSRFILPAFMSAVALFSLPSAASAQGFERGIIDSVMSGLGLVGADTPTLDYKERSPLVVPKDKSKLAVPQDAAAIEQNPQWPKDPDVAKRRALANGRALDTNDRAKLSSREELRKGAVPGTSRVDAPNTRGPNDGPSDRLTPSQLGYKGGLFAFGKKADDVEVFKGAPERERLTQPPTDYQLPSKDQPYGIVTSNEPPKPAKRDSAQ